MHMYIHGPCMDAFTNLVIYHFVPELLCITYKYENLMIIAVRLHCRLCSELNTTYVSTCTHINIHTHTLIDTYVCNTHTYTHTLQVTHHNTYIEHPHIDTRVEMNIKFSVPYIIV